MRLRQHIKENLSLVMEAAVSVGLRSCLSSSESSMRRLVEIKVQCPLPVIAMLRHLPQSIVVRCSKSGSSHWDAAIHLPIEQTKGKHVHRELVHAAQQREQVWASICHDTDRIDCALCH